MPTASRSADCDALILGGGPAGATAALMLASAGWDVAIIEKNSFPRRKVCGEFISATSLPLLAELGIAESYLASAGPQVRRVGLFEGDTVLAAPMPKPQGGEADWGRALGREHLDSLLLDAAVRAGAQLWQPWKATSLTRHHAVWQCGIEGSDRSDRVSAPIVIAAMGSWERSPLWDPAAVAHRDSDLLAFKAHLTDGDLASDLMPLLVFPGGYGGMVHSDNGRVSLSCCIRRDTLRTRREAQPGRAGDTVLQHIQESCLGVRQALARAQLDGAVLSAGPIQPGIRECYSDGIFFIGNSAGEAHPIIAEGISMAMQSAWLLCQRLIGHRDAALLGSGLASLANAYRRDWRRHFALRIRAAALFAHVAMAPAARDALRPLLTRVPRLLTLGAALSGKAKMLPIGPSPRARPSDCKQSLY